MAIIGLKIANGQFYPLLDETIAKKKKLVLTAAHNNQKSVQIDLYKSGLSSMADAQYLGSLVAEIDTSKEKESSIEMTISSNGKGEISASVKAEGSDKTQHLTVSIPSLEETAADISGEELEQAGSVPNALFETPPAKKFPSPPILLTALLLAVVGIGIWFFLFWNKTAGDSLTDAYQTEVVPVAAPDEMSASVPVAQTVAETPTVSGTATTPVAKPDVASDVASVLADADRTVAEPLIASGTAAKTAAASSAAAAPQARRVAVQKTPAPIRSLKVPAKIPDDVVKYKVRWGDTLWDIADVFYSDPWLTNRLARYNKIRNKNVLIPGTIVRIPPKSKLY